MARIRSVHPGLFTDESFIEMSEGARLQYIAMWTECDDMGMFEWKPIRLKMRLFPADDCQIEPRLEEMLRVGVVGKFEIDGKIYGAVRNFCKWQRPKSPKYDYPNNSQIRAYVSYSEPDADDAVRFNTLRKLVWETADGRCEYCSAEVSYYAKKSNSLQIDHRTPVSRGGSDDMANLACACRDCNSLKSDMTEGEFRRKFAPAELRARHGSQGANTPDSGHSPSAKTRSRIATFQMEDGEKGTEEKRTEEKRDSSSLRSDVSAGADAPPKPVNGVQAEIIPADEVRQAFDAYNAVAEPLGWPVAELLSEARRKKIRRRLSQCGGIENWRVAMRKASESAWLRGERGRDRAHVNWVPDLDFFLQQKSFTKLVEGAYDDRESASASGFTAAVRGFAAAAADLRRPPG